MLAALMKCVGRENAVFYKLRLNESCVFFVDPSAFGVVSCVQNLGCCYDQYTDTTREKWKCVYFLDVCSLRKPDSRRRPQGSERRRRTGGTRERAADHPPKKGSLDLLTFLLCERLGYILLCNVLGVAAVSKLTLGLFGKCNSAFFC